MKKFEDLLAIMFILGKAGVITYLLLTVAPGHMFEGFLTVLCYALLVLDFGLIAWIVTVKVLIKKGIVQPYQPEDMKN